MLTERERMQASLLLALLMIVLAVCNLLGGGVTVVQNGGGVIFDGHERIEVDEDTIEIGREE